MGFELDQDAASGLKKISGLTVSLLMHSGDSWENVVTSDPAGALGAPIREIAPQPREPAGLERPEAFEALLGYDAGRCAEAEERLAHNAGLYGYHARSLRLSRGRL